MTISCKPTAALRFPSLYDQCCAALAECRTTDEARHIRDKAKAIAVYARQAKNRTLEADACEIRLRAERRLGQMLLEHKATVGFANGGDAQRTRFRPGTESKPTLAEAGIDKKLSMNAQRLAKLSNPEFDGSIGDARERIMAEGRGRVQLNFTGDFEIYTPTPWVERARSAMGSIDLDPASCEVAQRVVKATKWFDKEQNGLAQPWRGNVWLNPPYGRGLIDHFIEKLITERRNYAQAIALVHSRTDTDWFQRLGDIAVAIAFPRGRINFYNETGRCQSAVYGNGFVYIGHRLDAFLKTFADTCLVLSGPRGNGARP